MLNMMKNLLGIGTQSGGNHSQIGGNKQNPNDFAKKFAKENNLDLDEAKKALQSKYGDPQLPNRNMNVQSSEQSIGDFMLNGVGKNDEDNGQRTKELLALGIPMNVIQQGDNAVEKYAQQHNIELPDKNNI